MKTVTAMMFAGVVLCSSLLMAAPGEGADGYQGARDDLHVYVVAGDAGVWGEVPASAATAQVMARCYILNDAGLWEPMRVPVAADAGSRPVAFAGTGFAKAMLAQFPDVSIGLVLCTAGNTMIEDWHAKSSFHRLIRKRAKDASKQGTVKGILWRHGSSVRLSALDHLKDLVTNIRADQAALNLPFVVGEVPGNPAMNVQLAALATDVHAVGVARLDGADDDLSALGSRYAGQVLAIQKEWDWKNTRPVRSGIPLIDAHIHGSSNAENGLDIVAQWMDQNNVSHAITHALSPTRADTEAQRAFMRANFAKYKGRILRFTFIEPEEVSSVEEAVAILEREKADGAIGFGEHYGVNRMFDDPANLRLFAACEKVGFPVMFHIDSNKNMVEKGMQQVGRALAMFPKVNFIAHADWWRYLPEGTCDRMLQDHSNLYADVSGLGMVAVLNRDRGYTEAFLTRHADRILFGSDEGWWSFGKGRWDTLTLELFEQLNLPPDVRHKIYRGNAERLFGLSGD